jgi:hypothetical protein
MYCSSDITAFFSQFRSHDSKSEYKFATLCSSYIYDVVIFLWTNWSLRQGSRTLREGYPHVLRRSGNQNGQPPTLHPAPCTLHPLARSAAVAPVPSSHLPFPSGYAEHDRGPRAPRMDWSSSWSCTLDASSLSHSHMRLMCSLGFDGRQRHRAPQDRNVSQRLCDSRHRPARHRQRRTRHQSRRP